MQKAMPFFKTALETNASIDQFWLSYINALMSLGRLADAQIVFDQARDKGVNGETFNQLEQQLLEQILQAPPFEQLQSISNLFIEGQLQQALSDATEALKRFPNSAILYNIVGASNAGLMQFDAAINSYKQALEIKSDYAEVYNNMGVALKGKGDPEAAIESYKQALKIKPDFAEVWNNLQFSLQTLQQQVPSAGFSTGNDLSVFTFGCPSYSASG